MSRVRAASSRNSPSSALRRRSIMPRNSSDCFSVSAMGLASGDAIALGVAIPVPARDHAAHGLLAEAGARIEARRLAQLLVELLLALGEGSGHGNVEHGVEIARVAAGLGQPLAGEAQL